jgi:2,3-bisphosphoglycerate-independent phosphoglycerate mutase
VETVDELGGIWLVTSDHGNAEEMIQRDKKGSPLMDGGRPVMLTSHTLNPIPVAIGGPGLPDSVKFRSDLPEKGIASIGSTIFNLLGYEVPDKKYNFEPTLLACG